MNIVVFDFDKTLTYKDTLLDFYMFVSKKNLFFYFKILVYLIFMILYKIRIIENYKLKKFGVYLFLRNYNIDELNNKSYFFSKRIKLNKIYENYNFTNNSERIIIISASFECYIKHLFPPNVQILASTLNVNNNFVNDLNFNCFALNKKLALNLVGIKKINLLYTDSYSDACLAEISNKTFVVFNDSISEFENFIDFKKYFKK